MKKTLTKTKIRTRLLLLVGAALIIAGGIAYAIVSNVACRSLTLKTCVEQGINYGTVYCSICNPGDCTTNCKNLIAANKPDVLCERSQPYATLPQKFSFSGIDWYKKEKTDGGKLLALGPGPNYFDSKNVILASDGLHLKINNTGSQWTSAELVSSRCFKYGTFVFQVNPKLTNGATIDKLDPNIVLGLFTYPEPRQGDVGELDGLHEIDVELANFEKDSKGNFYNLNYTVYPNSFSQPLKTKPLKFTLADQTSPVSFQIIWTSINVSFSASQNNKLLSQWSCSTTETKNPDAKCNVSTRSQPVRMNFWLRGGAAPINKQAAEIVIRNFNYTPYTVPIRY